MAPTKTNTGHGPLFDSFPSRPGSLHGGAKFDEGFNLQEKGAPKGPNFDEWGKPSAASSEHGPVWDEFGWKDMPDIHGGQLFDEGFATPTSHETSRGPLFDLFEPSSQVKFIYDGQDSEGIVDHVREDGIVMVTPRAGGNAVEVSVEQFLAIKSPSVENATTTAPPSAADAPSAHDATAHGGGILAGQARAELGDDLGPIINSVSGGPGNPDARTEIPEDWSTVDHLKSLLSGDDVAKAGPKSPFHSRYTHQAFPGDEHRHFADGQHIGTSSGSGGDSVKHAWAHAPGASRRSIVEGPKLGKFPSHEAAHVAIAEHHMDTHKSASSPLDVLKAAIRPERVEGVGGGYHMKRYPREAGVETVGHYAAGGGQIGMSQHKEGHAKVSAHAGRGGIYSHIGDFGSHEEAHRALVGTDRIGKTGPRLPSDVLKTRSEWSGVTAVAKDVTSAQTAVQGQDNAAPFAGAVGSGSYCPECREKKGTTTDDGRCPDCNTVRTAHEDKVIKREKGDGNGSSEDSSGEGVAGKTFGSVEDLRKAFGAAGDNVAGGQTVTSDGDPGTRGQQKGQAKSDPPDVPMDEREHKDSDHHSNMSGVPTECPHCGEVIAQLDEKTAQGAPSRTEPTTHKCVAGFLDMLKTGEENPLDGKPPRAIEKLREMVA